MRLPKGSPTCFAEEGMLTLQCPEFEIGTDTGTDYPDEYFIQVSCDDLRVGREVGFTYLSRLGFFHFYNDLKAAFNKRCSRGWAWNDYERDALNFFDRVERKGRKKLRKLNAIMQADPTPYNIKKRDELIEFLKRV